VRHNDLIALPGTSVRITRLGLGTVPLGGLFQPVDAREAQRTLEAASNLGIRYFDSAPLYGFGLAEERLGSYLRQLPRDRFVVSTKVGRLLRDPDTAAQSAAPEAMEWDDSQDVGGEPIFKGVSRLRPVWEFSYDGTLRSLDESLSRLGLDRIDIAFIHDPETHMDAALSGSMRALLRLRDEGVVGAIGVGLDHSWVGERFVRETDVDCLLVAGRYTLLDRSAGEKLLPMCLEAGVSVIMGSVFNSGILAAPPSGQELTFWYAPAEPRIREQVRMLRTICDQYDVPLAAAALQYPYRHDAVLGVVVGARSAQELEDDVAMLSVPIPDALWDDIEGHDES
jgi:D-threo-aldose 1-dehydrogenase